LKEEAKTKEMIKRRMTGSINSVFFVGKLLDKAPSPWINIVMAQTRRIKKPLFAI
jgi:hypothetical protein